MKLYFFRDCKSCDMVTLGIYPKSVDFNKNGNKIEMSKWISSRHNMGFAIDRYFVISSIIIFFNCNLFIQGEFGT